MNVLIVIVAIAIMLYTVTAMVPWRAAPIVPHIEKCSLDINGRIVNGIKADTNQFPWFATIRSHTVNGLQSVCGGSIISPIFILTAAHCTHGFVSYTVGFGSNTLNAPVITMHSKIVIQHLDYNPDNLNNDIAMIQLPSPLTFSSQIQAIRMPKISETGPDHFLYTKAQVCGFGRTEDGGMLHTIIHHN